MVAFMVPGLGSSFVPQGSPQKLNPLSISILRLGPPKKCPYVQSHVLAQHDSHFFAVSLIWVVSAANAITIFQWFFWGYSLAFSPTATNSFIGNLHNFGLRKVLANPSPGSPLIPDLLYSFFQMEFACVTACIFVGGVAERGRVFPVILFTFIWLTLVYCPLACWVWNPNGWAFKWGVLDFAGGLIA